MDFVRLLVHALVEWPGTPRERALEIFFQPTALEEALRRRGAGRLESTVVGPVELRRVETRGANDFLTLEFEALYTRRPAKGEPVREAVRLRWVLVRPRHVTSQDPDRMELLGCPSCGAPARVGESGHCAHCGVPGRAGSITWAVASSTELARRRLGAPVRSALPPLPRDLPTPTDEQLPIDGFGLADAGGFGSWEKLAVAFEVDVARPVLVQLVTATACRDLKPVRHLVGDRLWEAMRHRDELGLDGLAGCQLEEVGVHRCEYVRIVRDRYFDAITVRLFWKTIVYRTDERGTLIEGDPSKPRAFDDVLTFAKRRDARHRGERHAMPQCPKCESSIDRLSEAGICGYCQRRVTGGDYGWVLIDVDTPESLQG
jgi:ribosomal protein L37AE/L43A